MATVGLALCAAPAGAEVRIVAGDGVVKVGDVRCGASPCTLRAPSRVRMGIGGEGFRVRALVPRHLAAHARAAVRIKLGARAVKALSGATARVGVRIVVRAGGD
ncbi:MAG TPA: hypothetical protein VHA80_14165, partial [Solirubrobacterales bacterium]|nr:hypothetical protein [Solirubrobacterales bacterium]